MYTIYKKYTIQLIDQLTQPFWANIEKDTMEVSNCFKNYNVNLFTKKTIFSIAK